MLCPRCGNTVPDGNGFCTSCGMIIAPSATTTNVAPSTVPLPQATTSGKSIASLIFGCFSFLFPFAIVAIVLGHLSLSQINKSAGRIKGRGIAFAGLVLGYLGIAAIPFILIIAAIAIPNLLRARIAANEASAVQTVRLLVTAEITYQSAHPEEGYPCNLKKLVGYGDLNPALGSGTRHGYAFLLTCSDEKAGVPNTKFRVTAAPVKENQTGVRVFCSDESGIIKMDASGSAQECLENGEIFR